MIILDQMKNLKVYRVPMLMPTLDSNKKRHSAMLLLTPNYESSKKVIRNHMLVNRLRYQSYYMERDVSYYISGKVTKQEVEKENYFFGTENQLIDNSIFSESTLDPNTRILEDYIWYSGYDNDIRKIHESFNHDEYAIMINKLNGIAINEDSDIPDIEIVADRSCPLNEFGIRYDIDGLNKTSIIINPRFNKETIEKCVIESAFNQLIPSARNTIFGGYFAEVVGTDRGTEIFKALANNDLQEACKIGKVNADEVKAVYHLLETGDHSYIYYPIHAKLDDDAINESAELSEIDISNFDENGYISDDNTIVFFENTNDTQIKKLIYNQRLRKRSEVIEILKGVKKDLPEIKYAFPELDRYNSRNVFVDLHYYTEIFFKNLMWKSKKGFNLYLSFLDRLINDPRFKANEYTKKTVVVPITDWVNNSNTRMWLYKQSINPVSIIYQLMITGSSQLYSVFKDCNFLFLSEDSLFKLDLNEIDPKDLKVAANRLAILVRKTLAKEQFEPDEVDSEFDNNKKETKEVIKANIIDKIELSKGVDLTGKDKIVDTSLRSIKKDIPKSKVDADIGFKLQFDIASGNSDRTVAPVKSEMPVKKAVEDDIKKAEENKTPISKKYDTDKLKDMEHDKQVIANAIDNAAENSGNTDEALDKMNDYNDIKDMLANLSPDGTETVNPARASRMNKLDQKFVDSEVKGESVKDILSKNLSETPLKKTDLNIDSPNNEWKNLTYMNFDKNYDLNKDIVSCFYHFTKVSHPVAIRKLDVKDHSTSEDRLDLYDCQYEDAFGQRFSIKLDIPRAVNNRFLLRGNDKTIKTQLFNMPILKTDLDTCQCISNYQKIMIQRYNTSSGRTYPMAGKLIKALLKYEGKDVLVRTGDNSRICPKYELPIDYIDISSSIDTIQTKNYDIYFNQDELHEKFPNVDDTLGVPFAYNKSTKEITYFKITSSNDSFSYALYFLLGDESKQFVELVDSIKEPASGTYTRCSMLNSKIPMVIVCGLLIGLTETLKRAKIEYNLEQTKSRPKIDPNRDVGVIRFSDGYLTFEGSYDAYLLLNGLKDCHTEIYSITDIDDRNMYLEMLDDFGGRIKADGIYNFYDCFVDPITLENCKHYHLPTDFIDILLYSNVLLSDNKFVAHSNMASRRIRREEMIAAYTYETLGLSYGSYANQIRRHRNNPEFIVKQSAVIDKFLASDISSDSSTLSALSAIETTNEVTFKGKAGLNNSESYSLDKRLYDDSMLNVLATSTNFSANVGINRVASIDMNIEGERGYVKTINGDTSQFSTAKTLSATEAMTPFGTTRDDATRTNMTYVQTAKHMMRTEYSDPLLVTNGFDQVVPYMTTDKFAYKAKKSGKVAVVDNEKVIIDYDDGTHDYINLKETVEKNSDGGFYVPLKLDLMKGIRVGSRVKENDIIAYDTKSFSTSSGESNKLTYDIGKLAKVAIINTDGGYEDAGICGETLSKKLAARVIKKVDMIISKDATIYKIANINDEVKVNDPLIIWSDPHDEEDADTLARTLGTSTDSISEFGRRSLKSSTTGRVADIRLYRTVDISDMSPTLQTIFRNYEKPITALKKQLQADGIDTNELPADYKLEPTGKLKKAREGFLVEFFIEFLDTVGVGDKIVYFSANKAVIDNIIPESKAPYTDFRPKEPVDAFVSVTSIDKRMVSSTLVYGSLQKLLIELDRSVKDILNIPYDETEA